MALKEEQRSGGHDAIPITVGFKHLLKGTMPKFLIPLNMEKESAGFEFSDVHVMFARLIDAATMAISSSGLVFFFALRFFDLFISDTWQIFFAFLDITQ